MKIVKETLVVACETDEEIVHPYGKILYNNNTTMPEVDELREMFIWCVETFGAQYSGEFPRRWRCISGHFYFKYKEDAMMFMLRWGDK